MSMPIILKERKNRKLSHKNQKTRMSPLTISFQHYDKTEKKDKRNKEKKKRGEGRGERERSKEEEKAGRDLWEGKTTISAWQDHLTVSGF